MTNIISLIKKGRKMYQVYQVPFKQNIQKLKENTKKYC